MRLTSTLTTLGLGAFSILTCAAACSSDPVASGDATAGNTGKAGGGAGNAGHGGSAGKAGGTAGKATGGTGGKAIEEFGGAGFGGCTDDCCFQDCNAPTCEPGITMDGDSCEDYEEGEICAEENQDPCNFGRSLFCSNGKWFAQEAFPSQCGGAGGQGGSAGAAGQGGAQQ